MNETNAVIDNTTDENEKRIYTVEEISKMLGISKTFAYTLVKENHFKTVRIGSAIRISKKSFDQWLDDNNL